MPTSEADEFGGLFQEIVMQIGLQNACRLCAARGGRLVYFPKRGSLREGHWLPELLGMEAAEKLAEYMGGGSVDLPLGPSGGQRGATRLAIRRELARGFSVQQIAAMFGVTARTVRRYKNGEYSHKSVLKQDGKQSLVKELNRQAKRIEATPVELIEVMRRLLRRVPRETLEKVLQRIRQEAEHKKSETNTLSSGSELENYDG